MTYMIYTVCSSCIFLFIKALQNSQGMDFAWVFIKRNENQNMVYMLKHKDEQNNFQETGWELKITISKDVRVRKTNIMCLWSFTEPKLSAYGHYVYMHTHTYDMKIGEGYLGKRLMVGWADSSRSQEFNVINGHDINK